MADRICGGSCGKSLYWHESIPFGGELFCSDCYVDIGKELEESFASLDELELEPMVEIDEESQEWFDDDIDHGYRYSDQELELCECDHLQDLSIT